MDRFQRLLKRTWARLRKRIGRERARNLGVLALAALLLAIGMRFGVGVWLGGSEMARSGLVDGRAEMADDPGARGAAGDPGDGGGAADAAGAAVAGAAGGSQVAAAPVGRSTPSLNLFNRSILGRSLFDSAGVDTPVESSGASHVGDPFTDCAKSTLSMTLLGTMPAVPYELGTALLKGSESKDAAPRVYQVGDQLANDATLWGVYRKKIFVRRNSGEVECLSFDLEEGSGRRPARASKAKDEDKKPSGRHTWEGISKVGENEYEVSPDDVAYAMANMDRLSRDARITQYYKDGERSGFRLSSIRRNGVFGKLGFQNNDVITSINGMPISSTEQALQIYQSLQNDKDFSVSLLRRGQPTNMKFGIR
jgi:type II secretion system protein C